MSDGRPLERLGVRVHNLALAEDVVQDAFCRALEVWKVRGVPDNPSAWLMTTAKHRALDVIRRERTARTFAPELGGCSRPSGRWRRWSTRRSPRTTIRDEQLRMMFSCCHPRLPEEAQIALILNILCGFGAHEIASAFLTGRAAIEKRISRGKKMLAGAQAAVRSRRRRVRGCVCPPCGARCICCSTRAITARRPRRRCAPTVRRGDPADARCCASTRPRRRPKPTRSPR